MGEFVRSLQESLHKGFINQDQVQKGNYPPRLLINNSDTGEYVLTSFIEELENCESFLFSVAFITESGLATLKSYLWDLKQKNVRGRILTSTFLNFNHPNVFRELMKLDNVEVRLTDVKGFHSKGYIFKQPTHYSLIVGSSNLTANALKVNYEWNVKLTSHENGEFVHHFHQQFEQVWEKSNLLTKEWIEHYETVYTPELEAKVIHQIGESSASYAGNPLKEALEIKPNKMQVVALAEIQKLRDQGEKKGLIISATGTGKTYLSAFDVRHFAPKRMLFIVHREQILTKAKNDFRRVLGGIESDFGVFSGHHHQTDAKYLFATIQTISKQENMELFARDCFDYILIDEVHKAGASSYHRVIEYFKPDFFMGMTATPERSDGFNIYELFDYQIAYEIRLQEALEEDMLCPFHYFGVTDFEMNGETIDDTTILRKLVTEERINHILEKIDYYSFSGGKVRGLMFCSRKAEAKELSIALNERGFHTLALTGDDDQNFREQSVRQLENGELDYIITVDIFNEGIDIPSINQVVMLRQTASSIIFIQQLGRGLRKHNSKDFVTIIDFIGNYKNNYLIPIALSGDRSLNKDITRRHTKNTNYIKGVSTVNFEEVAKKRIFDSINASKLTSMKVMKDAYIELKNKLGRIPRLVDFILYYSIDPAVIIKKENNYHQFLEKIKESVPVLSHYENCVLSMFSVEFVNGKRMHDIMLFDRLLRQGAVNKDRFIAELREQNCRTDEKTIRSVERLGDLSFFTQTDRKKYGDQPIIVLKDQEYKFNEEVQLSLKSNDYFRQAMEDACQTALEKAKIYPCDRVLKLYGKYTRKDVCKLLNWENDESGTVFGYKTKHETTPIYVTYHKNEEVASSIAYNDHFINQEVMQWYTRNNRTLSSQELVPIIKAKEIGNDIHIFVKKDNDEGIDFYYMGKALPNRDKIEQTTISSDNGERPIVKMELIMETPVEYSLYQYLESE